MNLFIGAELRLKSLQHYFRRESKKSEGMDSASYKAPKGKVFVCLLLAVESEFPKPSEEIDITKALIQLGWTPPDDSVPADTLQNSEI